MSQLHQHVFNNWDECDLVVNSSKWFVALNATNISSNWKKNIWHKSKKKRFSFHLALVSVKFDCGFCHKCLLNKHDVITRQDQHQSVKRLILLSNVNSKRHPALPVMNLSPRAPHTQSFHYGGAQWNLTQLNPQHCHLSSVARQLTPNWLHFTAEISTQIRL